MLSFGNQDPGGEGRMMSDIEDYILSMVRKNPSPQSGSPLAPGAGQEMQATPLPSPTPLPLDALTTTAQGEQPQISPEEMSALSKRYALELQNPTPTPTATPEMLQRLRQLVIGR